MEESKTFWLKHREEPINIRWKMAGKTNEIKAHIVLPTRDAKTPKPGTNEAKIANTSTMTARLMYVAACARFPKNITSLSSIFSNQLLCANLPSTISLIGCNIMGNVKIRPTHNPT